MLYDGMPGGWNTAVSCIASARAIFGCIAAEVELWETLDRNITADATFASSGAH